MKPSVLRFCSLAAVAIAMTACSSDEPTAVAIDNAPIAEGFSVTAQLPIDGVLRPRAGESSTTLLGAGHQIKRLIYAVYDTDSNELLASNTVQVTPGSDEVTFNVNLPGYTTYRFFIWADAGHFTKLPSEAPYTVDLVNHTVKMNTKALASDEWRNYGSTGLLYPTAEAQPDDMDAFMFSEVFFISPAMETTLTLKRPLVAMTLLTTAADAIYSTMKQPVLGAACNFGSKFADTYNFFDDTVTVSAQNSPYLCYSDFSNNVNSLFTPKGPAGRKVLTHQYSFAPKNADNIPFTDTTASVQLNWYDGVNDGHKGVCYLDVELGEPSTWFKPNTNIILIDNPSSPGGSAIITSNPVKAVISSGFDGSLQPGV